MDPLTQTISSHDGHTSFIMGAQIARGAFCHVFKEESREKHIIKTFPIYRQFARTMRVQCALSDVKSDARDTIESVTDYGAFTRFDAQTFMPSTLLFVTMPQYEMSFKKYITLYIEEHNEGIPALAVITIAHRIFTAISLLDARDIVHGDIKPGNLMLRAPPIFSPDIVTSFDIVLCDFGSARFANRATHICAPSSVGTVPYIAPEIVIGRTYSSLADIWSAMLVVFFAIGGADLLDVYNDSDFDYGDIDMRTIVPHCDTSESRDSHKSPSSSVEIEPWSESANDDSREDAHLSFDERAIEDINFDEMYAYLLLLYRVIGRPSVIFCEKVAQFYHNGAPRFHTRLQPGTISEFFIANYRHINRDQIREIDHFLSLGLCYAESSRMRAREILAHPFLAPPAAVDAPSADTRSDTEDRESARGSEQLEIPRGQKKKRGRR